MVSAKSSSDEVAQSASIKVARHIMPLALAAFFITYVDRANLGIVGPAMRAELGLTPSAFGLAAGMFYVGYLIAEIPSNILLERFGGRRWFARILVTFGLITLATVFVWDDVSLVAVRVLLGIGEAGLYPGMLLFLGYWFSERRRGSNWLTFQLALPFSLAVGALVSSSLLNLDGLLGISGWRWVFIIEGLATFAVGLLLFRTLPDKPADARWLSAEEARAVEAETDIAKDRDVHGLRATLAVAKSPVAWYVTVIYFCSLVGFLTVTYWAPQIISERFALSPTASGLLSAVPWIVSCLALLLAAWIMKHGDHHAVIITAVLAICGVGMVISSQSGNAVIALIGLCLAATQQAVVPLNYIYIHRFFPLTLVAVAFAFVNSLANMSGLVGPWLLGIMIEISGSTRSGLLLLSSFFWIGAVLAAFAPAFVRWQERRRDAGQAHPHSTVAADTR
jgi:MFS transporter, ACS family, tartrate transporter